MPGRTDQGGELRRDLRETLVFVAVAACVLGLRFALPAEFIEDYYSRGAYLAIRRALDVGFGWWPVPASAVAILLAVAALARHLVRSVRRGRSASAKTVHTALAAARAVSLVAVAFMVLWGFNYGRVALPRQLGLQTERLGTEALWEELRETAKYVGILRVQLPLRDVTDYESLPLQQGTQQRIREAVTKQLDELGYPSVGHVRIREVVAGGLLRFNTSGVYFPLTGEGHVDEGLHSLQVPFVTAHEMLHGYGITDEGSCNFVAYLACTRADNLYLRYSGHLTYLRYLGAAVRRRDPEGYAAFRQNLPRAVRADLDSIAENNDRFAEIAPAVRDAVYDGYLRAQGVGDGMASYSRIIDLVAAWRSARRAPRAVRTAAQTPPR